MSDILVVLARGVIALVALLGVLTLVATATMEARKEHGWETTVAVIICYALAAILGMAFWTAVFG